MYCEMHYTPLQSLKKIYFSTKKLFAVLYTKISLKIKIPQAEVIILWYTVKWRVQIKYVRNGFWKA